jgi:predicted ABC-type ATPase
VFPPIHHRKVISATEIKIYIRSTLSKKTNLGFKKEYKMQEFRKRINWVVIENERALSKMKFRCKKGGV